MKNTTAKKSTGTKLEQVIHLLRRKNGASLDEVMSTTGWQRHTVRGFMSTLHSKRGLPVQATREGDVQTYKLPAEKKVASKAKSSKKGTDKHRDPEVKADGTLRLPF